MGAFRFGGTPRFLGTAYQSRHSGLGEPEARVARSSPPDFRKGRSLRGWPSRFYGCRVSARPKKVRPRMPGGALDGGYALASQRRGYIDFQPQAYRPNEMGFTLPQVSWSFSLLGPNAPLFGCRRYPDEPRSRHADRRVNSTRHAEAYASRFIRR